ncbi:MAG: hypothetical protein HZB19_04280 [Chloroflexi bacterium]|nr:hypothetical protein [Chloroflexota bacterium]
MRSDIKYLGYGLAISFFIAALIITGFIFASAGATATPAIAIPVVVVSPTSIVITGTPITPSPTFTATHTETPTATNTPTSTIAPSPTATLTSTEMLIANGEIVITGPLPREQQMRLYEVSIQFIASTFKESKLVGEKINGVGYGSPTIICGPLALAILQGAGLIEYPDIVPYDFWLLNPYISKDRALVNRVFPKDKYEDTLFKTPINKFDWTAEPLQPGDFLFIKHGTGGNFDHMLVVNRVDSLGRAYAVTNFGTANGYIINEMPLYDPNDPTVGLFHTWTAKQNSLLGSTGFGGFEVWRLRSP